MSLYLNTNAAYKDFQMLRNDRFFVDKSSIIEKILISLSMNELPGRRNSYQ